MSTLVRGLSIVAFLVLSWCCCPDACAVADKENQGRWTKPTVHNLPDKEVPGFLVNLGPTGARAVLTEKSFIIKYIFKDSPAVGRLKLDDEIIGVFGKPFSAHHFGGGHGYEGPIMELGEAIEKAEGKDGKLVLNLRNGSDVKDVVIDLEAIGSFSATFPYKCKKSEIVRAKALKYLAEHPDSWSVWQAHARSAVTLALLTSDDAKQQAIGKEMALKWSRESPDAGTWTWNLSYQLITLGEYHLLTKDPSVLSMMKTTVEHLEKAQYSGHIKIWGPDNAGLKKDDFSKVDAAQQLYDGGFGHAPYEGKYGAGGYGPMQYTTIFAVTAWQIAGRCGVPVKQDCIKRALGFIHRGTNAAGYVAYGGEFTLNSGLVDPVAWKASSSGDNYVGRTGAAIIAHKLSPEFADSADYLVKYRDYSKKAFKSMPDGHADANLGIFWGLMGSAASEDDTVLRTTFDYHKAYFNMARCFDGSFVLQPGRDYADDGYYMASRYHPTGTMILAYGLSNPKLLIQGIQVSIPGINPKALSGKLDLAYKSIVAKSYGDTLRLLKSVRSAKNLSAQDQAACDALLSHVAGQFTKELTELGALEKVGDFYALDAAFTQVKSTFGALDGFKEQAQHYEDGLKQEAWKAEIKLGARYVQLVATLTRSRSQTSVRDLEKFAEKNPTSLYGKWAGEVAKVFRADGVVSDPATEKTTVSGSRAAAKL
jgi:Family of unknown function (DUF6288)